MPTQERRKSPQSEDEGKRLKQLFDLINTPASKQQLPSLEYNSSQSKKSQKWPLPQPKSGQHQHQSTESVALEKFSCKYQSQRNFTNHSEYKKFSEIFSALTKQRLCCPEWLDRAPPENILRLLTCLRILMRDPPYQNVFYSLNGLKVLSELFEKATNSYMQYGDSPHIVDILKEMTNIFQKFVATDEQQREWLTDCNAHKGLVVLLHASDVIVLHCSLHALIGLSQSSKPRKLIGEMNCIEILLTIIQEYDNLSKKLSAKLLQSLCREFHCKETVTNYDGIPILLSQLHGNNVNLLLPLIWCLVQLCENPIASKEIRQMGGIPLILSLLHSKREFITERTETSDGAASAGPHGRTPIDDAMWEVNTIKKSSKSVSTKAEELMELQYKLKSACCAALTELVMNDANAQQIAQANGIYTLGSLILPLCKQCSDEEKKLVKNLQKNSFRALRFLFSMERNRRMFKRLFPPDVYELFINIGHYNRELNAYRPLVEKINTLPESVIKEIRSNINEMNQNKDPSRHIGDYDVFELLGSGAFGSVFKVKKRTSGQSFLAMKEIGIENPAFGKNSQERDQSVGEIINEIAIIREQMKHPNIVRYYKTFVEHQRLYIVMELIEGAPLGEHFSSLKEKRETFPEDRIWNIFMQMVLALRYLHKEKGILHRDLTPNNIMLGEDDKVTITDFGLAKQKRSDCSGMTSAVGTILYWCPEIVQNHRYGEKADIWALGCILYQMCTLTPPFFSDNMLTLVTKIVNAEFKPVPKERYSDRITQTIRSCICKSVDDRPDTVQLAAQIADKLLVYMDNLRVNQITMEKKLEKERRKAQRHYLEANQNMQRYHRLRVVSQEQYDRLANLAGSGGAQGLKDSEVIDPASVDIQLLKSVQSESVSSGGWTSDDDESCPSSGSESRESSAGSTRGSRLPPKSLPKPPGTPKTTRADRQSRSNRSAFSPLVLDIPNTSRAIRDSGYSSGDPSPNNSQLCSANNSLDPVGNLQVLNVRKYQRSHSTPNPNALSRTKKKPKRPNSANAPTVTISQRRVRQISDPILQMLHQLHKILFICQLPPTLYPNPKRTKVERFKRSLFIQQSSTLNLKSELKKLMSGSREIIDLNLGPTESKRANSANSVEEVVVEGDKVNNQYDPDFKEAGITYEQMQTIIESLLLECGYYSVPASAREATPPLGPIVSDDLMKQLVTPRN